MLSGEETDLPAAEAEALTKMLDPAATFSRPERRVLIARSTASPGEIEARVAYSRRVGTLVEDELSEDDKRALRRGTFAVKVFDLLQRHDSVEMVARIAEEVGGRVDLENPEAELTIVRGEEGDYLALTRPSRMNQNWVARRPRARAFFHPSAIFPKFSRFMVNLTRVAPGEVFLDPFCGTGSLLLEAYEVGAVPVGIDLHSKMTSGATSNARKFGQVWSGVVRADARSLPISRVDALATDIPYGRVSSTSGSSPRAILENLINQARPVLDAGRRLVVMHPDTLGETLSCLDGFEVEERHSIPVHKKLTRMVTVMRRS